MTLFASPPQGVASALSAYAPTTGQVLWSAPKAADGVGRDRVVNGHLYVMGNLSTYLHSILSSKGIEFRFRAHVILKTLVLTSEFDGCIVEVFVYCKTRNAPSW